MVKTSIDEAQMGKMTATITENKWLLVEANWKMTGRACAFGDERLFFLQQKNVFKQ